MKKLLAIASFAAATIFGIWDTQAQTYKTGAGLLVDVGEDFTLVGPHVKHFFSKNSAGELGVLFGGDATTIQALYQFNNEIPGAKGLMWYVGLGPAISFSDGYSEFSIVPVGGLDYKVSGAPIDLFFDWRPRVFIYDGDTDFHAGRFGLGVRFTF